MAIDIDCIAVLRAIALAPNLFPDAAPEINKFTRKYLTGQLKSAAMSLERLRDIYRAIGGEAFVLMLDGLADSASATFLKKLDKENPELKTASPGWCRKRLANLASGAGEPARKPLKTPKNERARKNPTLTPEQKEIGAGLKAKAMTADKARALWLEAGEANFTLVLASVTEKQTRDLAKRLDKDNPDLMSAPLDQLRQRVADLARGTAEPVFKNILEYSSMKVTRTRTPKGN
jgi:hypothetical protein